MPLHADEKPHDPDHAENREAVRQQAAQPHRPIGMQRHGERPVALDRGREDAAADVGGLDGAACRLAMAENIEPLARALPQHVPAPAQRAARELRREAVHDEQRESETIAIEQIERLAIALEPHDVARVVRPVVEAVVHHAQPRMHRIGEIDAGHAPRKNGAVKNVVGRKCEPVLLAVAVGPPAAATHVVAAPLRRILLGELAIEEGKDLARQFRGLRRVRVGEERVVPLLDARRRQQDVPGRDDCGQDSGRDPAGRQRVHRADEDHQRRADQHGVVEQIVDRKADRRDGKRQHRNLLSDDHAGG